MSVINHLKGLRITEQDACRLLIILHELGDPPPPNSSTWTRKLETQVYLQKLHYLVRNPSDLAYAVLARVASAKQQYEMELCKKTIRALTTAKEPRLKTLEMMKFRFGPWESLDDVMTLLECYDLVSSSPRKAKGGGQIYFLNREGAELVTNLYKKHPELKYYQNKCEIIRRYLSDLRGVQLSKFLYSALDRLKSTPLGRAIPSHRDLVPGKFENVFGEPLEVP